MLDAVFPNDDYITAYAADKEIKKSCYRFKPFGFLLHAPARKNGRPLRGAQLYQVSPDDRRSGRVVLKTNNLRKHPLIDAVKFGTHRKDLMDSVKATH